MFNFTHTFYKHGPQQKPDMARVAFTSASDCCRAQGAAYNKLSNMASTTKPGKAFPAKSRMRVSENLSTTARFVRCHGQPWQVSDSRPVSTRATSFSLMLSHQTFAGSNVRIDFRGAGMTRVCAKLWLRSIAHSAPCTAWTYTIIYC